MPAVHPRVCPDIRLGRLRAKPPPLRRYANDRLQRIRLGEQSAAAAWHGQGLGCAVPRCARHAAGIASLAGTPP